MVEQPCEVTLNRLALVLLAKVATGELAHIYRGKCPDDVDGHHQRDAGCPACQAIVAAESALERGRLPKGKEASHMNLDAMELSVRKWAERMTDLLQRLEALNDVLMQAPESPLNSAMYAVVGGYIEALDVAYSIGGWLEWWWLECDMGGSPREAKLVGDAGWRKAATVDDLVQLLRDEQAGAI